MNGLVRPAVAFGCAAMLALLMAPPAGAATGDTMRVIGERVNLRAGPSDEANVRSQVIQGEQLIELRRDGNWYGVRVLRTGEEGWIFSDLVEPLAPTTLSGGVSGWPSAGFTDLSPDFDRLMANVSQRYGFRLFQSVRQTGDNTLEATLTPQWLRAGSDDEHLLAATAMYQMWKNHQNGAPVRIVLLEPGGEGYIAIDDTQTGGSLLVLAAD
jgi:hypothetical protein